MELKLKADRKLLVTKLKTLQSKGKWKDWDVINRTIQKINEIDWELQRLSNKGEDNES